MKKRVLILVFIALLTLVGCNEKEERVPTEMSTETTSVPLAAKTVIESISKQMNDDMTKDGDYSVRTEFNVDKKIFYYIYSKDFKFASDIDDNFIKESNIEIAELISDVIFKNAGSGYPVHIIVDGKEDEVIVGVTDGKIELDNTNKIFDYISKETIDTKINNISKSEVETNKTSTKDYIDLVTDMGKKVVKAYGDIINYSMDNQSSLGTDTAYNKMVSISSTIDESIKKVKSSKVDDTLKAIHKDILLTVDYYEKAIKEMPAAINNNDMRSVEVIDNNMNNGHKYFKDATAKLQNLAK